MRKIGIVAITIAMSICAAQAQQTYYRDSAGRLVGSSTSTGDGGAIYRDEAGRMVGSKSSDGFSGSYYRDETGRLVGSSTETE